MQQVKSYLLENMVYKKLNHASSIYITEWFYLYFIITKIS